MRRGSSTALALALMILLAPLTALACERQCAPDALSGQGAQVSAQDSVGSCHRSEEPSSAADSIRASLHECGTHAIITTGPARLSLNRASDVAPVAMLSQPRVAEGLAPRAAAPPVSRILAPPGPSSGSMTPLRV